MFCRECGKEVKASAKFCPYCGTNLEQEFSEKNVTATVAGTGDKQEKEKKSSVRTLEMFKEELQQLSKQDSETASTLLLFGNKMMFQYIFPILNPDERVIGLRSIQSKLLLARYRKECMILTDQRVIKFECLQYLFSLTLPPTIESIYYQQIANIEAEEESSGVAGTFLGEKIIIEASEGKISAKTVGKGSAQKLKQEILNHKENCKVFDIPEIKNVGTVKTEKKPCKKRLLFIPLAVLFLLWWFLPAGNHESDICINYIKIRDGDWGTTVTLTADNLSDSAIKDVRIGFAAWNEYKLPITLEGAYIYDSDTYFFQGDYNGINIVENGSGEIDFTLWNRVDELIYVLPVIVSYENYDGKIWQNPDLKELQSMAGKELKGKMLDKVYKMERSY